MKAIGFKKYLPISNQNSLFEFEAKMPVPNKHDLLVKVLGVSLNPVDTGVRRSSRSMLKHPKVIGWDAVGKVVKTGSNVSMFNIGDKVFYAGSIKRPGSDSEYQLVDERIVGNAPEKLNNQEIAAMPLTSLTAWEALFEKLQIDPQNKKLNRQKRILIINGSGGVGSIATQLAHRSGLNVIATASRPETIKWTKKMGANYVINHRKNLVKEMNKLNMKSVDYILELNNIDQHWNEMAKLIKPDGKIASITENKRTLDLQKLTKKRATFAWEWMYSKSYYETANMVSQHYILNKISKLLDEGLLQTTVTKTFFPINSMNLRKAHKLVESGHMIGKVTITN